MFRSFLTYIQILVYVQNKFGENNFCAPCTQSLRLPGNILTCCHFWNRINKIARGNWDVCLPVFFIKNWEGLEVTMVSQVFWSPQFLRRERKQSKTCEKMHSRDNLCVMIWMNHGNESIMFCIWAAVIRPRREATVASRPFSRSP